MRFLRQSALVAVGVLLGIAATVPIAAQSQKQIKQAMKLLEKVKLVDGSGSGLDADTVQGMTPAQVAAGAPTETLEALKSVDGQGSGLDADTLRGLTPEQLMVTGGGGGGLVVLDVNNAVVGNLVNLSGSGGAVARRVDGRSLGFSFDAGGFFDHDDPTALSDFELNYESADCTGVPVAIEDPDFPFSGEVLPFVSVHAGTGYYVAGPSSQRTTNSFKGFVSDPAQCAHPDPSISCTFAAPESCCCSFPPETLSTATYATIDIASLGLIPPFRVELP